MLSNLAAAAESAPSAFTLSPVLSADLVQYGKAEVLEDDVRTREVAGRPFASVTPSTLQPYLPCVAVPQCLQHSLKLNFIKGLANDGPTDGVPRRNPG